MIASPVDCYWYCCNCCVGVALTEFKTTVAILETRLPTVGFRSRTPKSVNHRALHRQEHEHDASRDDFSLWFFLKSRPAFVAGPATYLARGADTLPWPIAGDVRIYMDHLLQK